MSMTDPIADMLTRIRNASKARKRAVDIPASNIKREIAKVLLDENFIKDIIDLPDRKQGIVRVYLKYSKDDEPIIKGMKRLSRPGLRKYIDLDDMRSLRRSRFGVTILSTSQGIMTTESAFEKRVGGEAICLIW